MTHPLDPLGERTLSDLLAERVDGNRQRTFIVYETAEGEVSEFTYAEFADGVQRRAAALGGLGIGRGDCVVVHLRNCPEFLEVWFALGQLGAVLVPSNTANTGPEIAHLITATDARLAITEPALLDEVREAAAPSDGEVEIIIGRGEAPGHRSLDELDAPQATAPAVHSDDLCELIFTSGTTRKPKAVMLTHANCVRAGLDAVHCLWLDEHEVCLTALPLFHVNAQSMSALAALTVAGTLVLLQEFRASRYWEQVRRHRATQTSIVAMQARTLLARAPSPDDRDHRLRRLFYSINVTTEEKAAFEERFGVTLINGYGLSEANTLVCCSPVVGPRRWPSIGLPSPGRQVLLLDEHGDTVPAGKVGEIVVVGTPGRDIMLGYYREPEVTAATLSDGRMHTGDTAYADEQGFLYFFDRRKDMIKRAGENISALEVEDALLCHPAIAEAAVIGVPDPVRDEAVVAVVVGAPDHGLAEDDVIAHCRTRLARFKVPSAVLFADELPKTSIGKVRKDRLRALAAERTRTPAGSSLASSRTARR